MLHRLGQLGRRYLPSAQSFSKVVWTEPSHESQRRTTQVLMSLFAPVPLFFTIFAVCARSPTIQMYLQKKVPAFGNWVVSLEWTLPSIYQKNGGRYNSYAEMAKDLSRDAVTLTAGVVGTCIGSGRTVIKRAQYVVRIVLMPHADRVRVSTAGIFKQRNYDIPADEFCLALGWRTTEDLEEFKAKLRASNREADALKKRPEEDDGHLKFKAVGTEIEWLAFRSAPDFPALRQWLK
ncbi:MAG: hypothetical protein MHM6MM_007708, partial [Cercozoa sp. M6MM]